MKFTEPYSTSCTIAGRFRRIDILPDLLNLWWGEGSGPQVPGALVEAYGETIDEMLAMMIEEGRVP